MFASKKRKGAFGNWQAGNNTAKTTKKKSQKSKGNKKNTQGNPRIEFFPSGGAVIGGKEEYAADCTGGSSYDKVAHHKGVTRQKKNRSNTRCCMMTDRKNFLSPEGGETKEKCGSQGQILERTTKNSRRVSENTGARQNEGVGTKKCGYGTDKKKKLFHPKMHLKDKRGGGRE